MENIKYVKEMTLPSFNGGSYVDGYHIEFNDGSELEIHMVNGGFLSTTDCMSGKDRNTFKKNNTFDKAIHTIKNLIKMIGFSNTNKGRVIIVNNSDVKTQIII